MSNISPSSSPRSLRRLSSSASNGNSNREQQELINAYEAEEERITNVLSRKLEQLRVEKIELENVLEAESESHVNRLSRELALLRAAQQQQQQPQQNGNGAVNRTATTTTNGHGDPTVEVMLEALRRENEQLRSRLADIERDYIRMSRLNEIYREELIDHRNRLGQPVDNLIGMSSLDPYSQPTHHRSSSSLSSSSGSMYASTHMPSRPANGVPIPRPPSQIRRPNNNTSEGNTPLSHSPTSGSSASESPYALSSPGMMSGGDPASLASNLTTPPSSASLHNLMQYNGLGSYGTVGSGPRSLSYPSVPPPSLSSSFGSPNVAYHMSHREPSLSPVEPFSLSRRNSNAGHPSGASTWRVAETGSLRSIGASRSNSRRESLERGARVAETGSLSLARSRAGSHSQGLPLPPTTEDVAEVIDDETVFLP